MFFVLYTKHLKRRFFSARCLYHVGSFRASRAETPGGNLIGALSALYIKQIKKYYEISTMYECVEKLSMIIGSNIWMICLNLNSFFYVLSRMLQLSLFVWKLRSSVWVVFNDFLLIDATDRSKISSDQHW